MTFSQSALSNSTSGNEELHLKQSSGVPQGTVNLRGLTRSHQTSASLQTMRSYIGPSRPLQMLSLSEMTSTNYKPGNKLGRCHSILTSVRYSESPTKETSSICRRNKISRRYHQSKLSWKPHKCVNNICMKANSTRGFLQRNLRRCPATVKRAGVQDLHE